MALSNRFTWTATLNTTNITVYITDTVTLRSFQAVIDDVTLHSFVLCNDLSKMYNLLTQSQDGLSVHFEFASSDLHMFIKYEIGFISHSVKVVCNVLDTAKETPIELIKQLKQANAEITKHRQEITKLNADVARLNQIIEETEYCIGYKSDPYGNNQIYGLVWCTSAKCDVTSHAAGSGYSDACCYAFNVINKIPCKNMAINTDHIANITNKNITSIVIQNGPITNTIFVQFMTRHPQITEVKFDNCTFENNLPSVICKQYPHVKFTITPKPATDIELLRLTNVV